MQGSVTLNNKFVTETRIKVPLSLRLPVLRAARGLTQTALAVGAGVPPRAISEYERGLNPNPAHIQAISDFLGIDLSGPEVEQAILTLSGNRLD